MNGETMDDNSSSDAMGMVGFQQQAKSIEPSQPGSSNSGWGTCAELLLVSAVKKHGVPNWNLVALELKARAILLNISPTCFSEESCKHKYSALKGKFASSSSNCAAPSMDDDLGGMSWFEELRKLRMSHLKEELQVYDSSIGQLKSRISKLKEERAKGLSLQAVMKQYDSSYGVDMYPRGSKTADLKASISMHPTKHDEKSQDMALKDNSDQADSPGGKLGTGSLDGQHSSGMAHDGRSLQKDGPISSTPDLTSQDAQEAALTAKQSISLESDSPGKKGAEKNSKDVENKVLQGREDEIGEDEPVLERWASTLDQATTGERSGSFYSGGGEDNVPDYSVTSRIDNDLVKSEKQETEAVQDGREGMHTKADIIDSILYSLPGSASTTTDAVRPEEVPCGDPPEALIVTSEVPSGTPEAEASSGRGSNAELNRKRDSQLSRVGSLSHGRAEKEMRLKAKEEVKLERLSWPEVREVVDSRPSQRPAEAVGTVSVEGKDIKETSALVEQSELNKISSRDRAPLDEVDAGSTKQNIRSDISPAGLKGFGEGEEKGPDSSGLGNDRKPVLSDLCPRDVGVLPASPGFGASKGAESRPLGVDLLPLAGTLTVALRVDPDNREPSVVGLHLENIPKIKSELDISQLDYLRLETAVTANENRGLAPAEVDEKSERVEDMTMDEIRLTLEARQDKEGKIEEVDTVAGCEEGEKVDTDLGTFRSMGDDGPETLTKRGTATAQEESRDCPNVGEGQQPLPDCTDSQIDKSEVGSSMDSREDMSPSSRKNRREPKVPGKFLPLLECLRVICAHKFATPFKQRQEYQDNAEYERLVRRHVDLGMVRARLEDGAYSGNVEFFRDLLLIFTNAMVYNSSESQEYAGAKALRSCALVEMDRILQTEALLKQNGPATRKREVRKSMEVHKTRVASTSGSDGKKKGILKGIGIETPAALDLQGGPRSSHIAVEDTPHAGRSCNNEDDLELDDRIEISKKPAPNHPVKEETPQKELEQPDVRNEGGNRTGVGGILGKKVKVENAAQKLRSPGQVMADLRVSGGCLNAENKVTKTTPSKMKDVMCINVVKEGPSKSSSRLAPSGLTMGHQQTPSTLKQNSTSRISRHSKRAGESTAPSAKKRVRK